MLSSTRSDEPGFSGMAPLIRAVLSSLVGEEAANEIEIIANDVIVHADGKWEIKFRHPSRSALPILRIMDR